MTDVTLLSARLVVAHFQTHVLHANSDSNGAMRLICVTLAIWPGSAIPLSCLGACSDGLDVLRVC